LRLHGDLFLILDHFGLFPAFQLQGATEVASLLRGSTTLTTLNLRNSGLHSTGVSIVASALAENKFLTSLDLSGNEHLTSNALSALSRALQHNSSIQVLKLDAACEASHQAADYAEFGQVLGRHPSLRALSMAECLLGVDVVGALGQGLAGSCSLTSLDLQGNDLVSPVAEGGCMLKLLTIDMLSHSSCLMLAGIKQ
jgi:Ran GTPase-activating protein (RanGAP) involved in mRNA processing and transport